MTNEAAGATPKASKSPRSDAESRKLLKKGQKALRRKNYTAAIKRFEQALKLAPGKPAIHGGLGWALFKKKHYSRAENHLAQALNATRKPAERAELLYRLGRVLQARGGVHKTTAARYYEASLAVRRSTAVAARLDTLDVAPDTANGATLPDALCREAMKSQFCELKRLVPLEADNDDKGLMDECDCSVAVQPFLPGPKGTTGLHGLAHLVLNGEESGSPNSSNHLALRFGKRWFLGPRVIEHFKRSDHSESRGTLRSLETPFVPGIGRIARATVRGFFSDKFLEDGEDFGEVHEHIDTSIHICWLSAKGPKCIKVRAEHRKETRALVPADVGRIDKRTNEEKAEDAKETKVSGYRLAVILLPDGRISVKLVAGALDEDTKRWLGIHMLEAFSTMAGVKMERL